MRLVRGPATSSSWLPPAQGVGTPNNALNPSPSNPSPADLRQKVNVHGAIPPERFNSLFLWADPLRDRSPNIPMYPVFIPSFAISVLRVPSYHGLNARLPAGFLRRHATGLPGRRLCLSDGVPLGAILGGSTWTTSIPVTASFSVMA